MANVLNRTTLKFVTSVDTTAPGFIIADWVIGPDMAAVEGVPRRYWVLTGDAVTVMDQTTRDAVDAALLAQAIADDREQQKARLEERLFKAFAIFVVKQMNKLEAGTFVTLTAQSARDAIKAEVDNI